MSKKLITVLTLGAFLAGGALAPLVANAVEADPWEKAANEFLEKNPPFHLILEMKGRSEKRLEQIFNRLLEGLGVCFGREALKDLPILANEKFSEIPFNSFS